MKLSNGEKKYLLGVILTCSEYGWTRLKWVADLYNVKLPTAKEFLGSLAKKGLLDYHKRGAIFLTRKGKEIAEKEKKKFETVVTFMTKCLLVDEDTAKENALKILFDLDEILADRMYKFIDMITKCPSKPVILDKFEHYVKDGTYQICKFCPMITVKEGGCEKNDNK